MIGWILLGRAADLAAPYAGLHLILADIAAVGF
jgi:hypothetical protein